MLATEQHLGNHHFKRNYNNYGQRDCKKTISYENMLVVFDYCITIINC